MRDPKKGIGFFLELADAKSRGEIGKHLRVRARFPDRLDYGPDQLQRDRSVALGDVVVLEKCCRGQHNIGVPSGVGEHLFVHNREQVVALEAFEHPVLVGHCRQRVAVVHEQHVNSRIVVLGQRASEVVHVDQPCLRFGCGVHPRGWLDAQCR